MFLSHKFSDSHPQIIFPYYQLNKDKIVSLHRFYLENK